VHRRLSRSPLIGEARRVRAAGPTLHSDVETLRVARPYPPSFYPLSKALAARRYFQFAEVLLAKSSN